MLDGTSDDVRPRLDGQFGREDNTLDGMITGLAAAAGENYLIGLRADQIGDFAVGAVHGGGGFETISMLA